MSSGAAAAVGTGTLPKLLLDTNVWVDYAEGNPATIQSIMQVLDARTKKRAVLYVSPLSLKDAFYLIQLRSKRALEAEHGSCSPGDYLAIQDMAAACVRMFMDFALVVPLGHNECLHAMSLRPVHGDFEDDLIVAAAARVNADYLVSSDKRLRHHAPVACLTPQEAAALLTQG